MLVTAARLPHSLLQGWGDGAGMDGIFDLQQQRVIDILLLFMSFYCAKKWKIGMKWMIDRNEKRREARGGYVCSFRIQGLERATRITNHQSSQIKHGPRHIRQIGLTTALQGDLSYWMNEPSTMQAQEEEPWSESELQSNGIEQIAFSKTFAARTWC